MDKFKGTLTASEAAAAVCEGASGHVCVVSPVGDGGDGTIEAFGGVNQWSTVTGPHGGSVTAGWRLDGEVAFVEMAAASGLVVSEGRHDPITATTFGTGQLIAEAIKRGASRIRLGVGGSATTDGGLGAIEALEPLLTNDQLPVPVTVLCDVTTRFSDAARTYGRQKGATQAQIGLLTERLDSLRLAWIEQLDVDAIPGSGAAGGLAGGLAVLGALLAPGFDIVAEHLNLPALVADSDLVFTGEGRFDATSLDGKATGGVLALAWAANVPAIVISGSTEFSSETNISLEDEFGDGARTDPAGCIERAVQKILEHRDQQGK